MGRRASSPMRAISMRSWWHLRVRARTRCLAIPNLLTWAGSAIVLDIKGELAATTAEYRRTKLGQKVIRLDPWKITTPSPHRLNPLDPLRRTARDRRFGDAALGDARQPENGRARSILAERAQNLVAGILAYVATDDSLSADNSRERLATPACEGRGLWHSRRARHVWAKMPPFARGVLASFLQTTGCDALGHSGDRRKSRAGVFGSEAVRRRRKKPIGCRHARARRADHGLRLHPRAKAHQPRGRSSGSGCRCL